MKERKEGGEYLRIIVTINLLNSLDKFPRWLVEVFQSLSHRPCKLLVRIHLLEFTHTHIFIYKSQDGFQLLWRLRHTFNFLIYPCNLLFHINMLATRFESMLLRKFNVRLIIGPIIIFIFKLNVYESHTHLVSKIIKYICIFDRILTYHSLYIKYSCALIDMPFGSDGASWELIVKGSLKLLNVVLNVAVKCSGLHELGCINLA